MRAHTPPFETADSKRINPSGPFKPIHETPVKVREAIRHMGNAVLMLTAMSNDPAPAVPDVIMELKRAENWLRTI